MPPRAFSEAAVGRAAAKQFDDSRRRAPSPELAESAFDELTSRDSAHDPGSLRGPISRPRRQPHPTTRGHSQSLVAPTGDLAGEGS